MKTLALLLGTALAVLSLVDCGGGPTGPTVGQDIPVANDPQLVAMWSQAQNVIATQPIVLNAASAIVYGLPPLSLPPDPRAREVSDDGVVVTLVADLTVAELHAENPGVTLKHNTDPTGVIHSPQGGYCASYVEGSHIYVAASQEYSFRATGWEMRNVILSRLGYDLSGR
jgi:hypothetical protein